MGCPFARKKKKTKDDIARHFRVRCMERLGAFLSSDELRRRMIERQLKVVCKESSTRTHFLVPKEMLPETCTREIVAVYDKKRHDFVTVLFNDGGIFNETDDVA